MYCALKRGYLGYWVTFKGSLTDLTRTLYFSKVSFMKPNSSPSEELYRAILSLKTLDEAKRFFRDLLTEEEIEEFSKRLQAARMLNEEVPYTVIQEKTGLSSTTVARISRWLKNGMNGYRLVLDRDAVATTHHTRPS